jgi:Flp pilus assembly protein TadB
MKWVNTIHNDIRKRNGSQPFSIEKTLKYYDKQYTSGSKNSYKNFFIIFIFICVVLYLLKKLYFTPLQENI